MENLRNRLREYMGEKDLSVREVASLLNRHPLTIWKFLHGKTEPHDQTLYQIRRLVLRRKAKNQGENHATVTRA